MFQLWFGGFSREGGNGGRRQPLRRRNQTLWIDFTAKMSNSFGHFVTVQDYILFPLATTTYRDVFSLAQHIFIQLK